MSADLKETLRSVLEAAAAERQAREKALYVAHFGSLERASHMADLFADRYVMEDHIAQDGTLIIRDKLTGWTTRG